MGAVLRKVLLCILVGIIVLIVVQSILGIIARLFTIFLLGALVLFVLSLGRGGDDD